MTITILTIISILTATLLFRKARENKELSSELEKVSTEYGQLANLCNKHVVDLDKMLEQFEFCNLQIELLQKQLNEKEETIEKLHEILRSSADSSSDNSLLPRHTCAPSNYS